MSERKDEQWLDKQLQRAVDGSTPAFDAAAWQRNHAEAYHALTSRARQMPNGGGGARSQIRWMAGGLAAAAVVLIGAAVLLMRTSPQDSREPASSASAEAASPARIVSMISLRTAYRQGGEEALNQQLDMALDRLGPRLNGPATLRVVWDLDG